MAKRGRKRIHLRYFDTPQEEAIIVYLNSNDSKEREDIYLNLLKEPLYKMVESIINRYKLYSYEMSFDELLDDTLSFLHTKLDKFEPSQGCKAYSYYGTIIKHRLLGKRIKEQNDIKRKISFETQSDLIIQDEKLSYEIDNEDSILQKFFYEYVNIIEKLLIDNESEDFLKPNEEILGHAIVHLMKEWENVFEDGGHKYNKNQVLECLRTMTNLNTKDIRDSLKVYKKLYFEKKQEKLNTED